MPESNDLRFSPAVIKDICEKAAARCANPNCRRLARLPNRIGEVVVSFGDAAHILPASNKPNAPRYEPDVPDDQITDESNGIWLCASCHRIIDRDPGFYKADKLRQWKALSEKECDYDPPTVALSLPGHYVAEGNDRLPGLSGTPAKIGVHVLVGPSVGLRAVGRKITLELISEFGAGELRCEQFYEDPGGVPKATTDWQSFMLSAGQSEKIYFKNSKLGWLSNNPRERTSGVVLIRAKVYSRLGADDLEPFVSPWEVAILDYKGRLEIDQTNDYAHLVRWADTLNHLARSDNRQFKALVTAIFHCQTYHSDWAMFVVESIGNERIDKPLELIRAEPGSLLNSIPPTYFVKGDAEAIEAGWMPNGYIIKRLYWSNPAKNSGMDRTDIQEFWNGNGGLQTYLDSGQTWVNNWAKSGQVDFKIISNGGTRPGGLPPLAGGSE